MRNDLQQLPPQDLDMEANILGASLIDGTAIGLALEELRAGDFYAGAHQKVFAVIGELFAEGKPVDQSLVRERLASKGELEDVGGVAYLAQLVGAVPTTANVEHYARIVKDKSEFRQLVSAGRRVIRSASDPGADCAAVKERLESDLMAMAAGGRRAGASARELSDRLLAELEAGQAPKGLDTGIPLLDEILGGLRRGELNITAARTNVGKTTLALNIVRNVSERGVKVLLFSVEMGRGAIARHLVRQKCGLNLFTKAPVGADLEAVILAARELGELPLVIEDGTHSLSDIRSKVRRYLQRGQCDLVIVDYLQRVKAGRGSNRQEEVAELARGLKSIAVDADVPVLALCQLNRMSEQREGRRPRLSDLRDSGELEQEADGVLLLHRPNKDRPLSQSGDDGAMELTLAKSRNTPVGEGTMWLDRRTGLLYADEYARNCAEGAGQFDKHEGA